LTNAGGMRGAGAPTDRDVADALVSIIIPSFNHAHYLPDAIGSALGQTYTNIEVVVVDDGSTDDTVKVVNAIHDERLHLVEQTNRGLSRARNEGLALSRGEYVVFLDADDRLRCNHIQRGLDVLTENRFLGFVCGDIAVFGDQNFDHRHSCAPRPDHYATLLRGCFIVNVGACLFPRSILSSVGAFDEDLVSAEDWDLFLKVARGYPIICHHGTVLDYRRTTGQMSSDPELMLHGSTRALNAQWAFARQHPAYREAYREGLNDIAKYYGAPGVDLAITRIRQNDWRGAINLVTFIISRCPRAFLWWLGHRWRRLLQ
jgi:glycosyltransferase involved in cell wall biosynthesis